MHRRLFLTVSCLFFALIAQAQNEHSLTTIKPFILADPIEVHESLKWIEDSLFVSVDNECALLKAFEPTPQISSFLEEVYECKQLMFIISDHYTAWSLSSTGDLKRPDVVSIYHFQQIVKTIKKLFHRSRDLVLISNYNYDPKAKSIALKVSYELNDGVLLIAKAPILDELFAYATFELISEEKGNDAQTLLKEKWDEESR